MAFTILVIDDEEGIRQSLGDILEDEGYEVITAENGRDALSKVFSEAPDLIFLDIWLPDIDGMEVLEEVRKRLPHIPVVMISGHATVELAVKATKIGAYDFLEKPLALERVLLTTQRALERRSLERKYDTLLQDVTWHWELVGESPSIRALREQIDRLSLSPSRVLISGESGTGKELVARLIHERGPRHSEPFIPVNCAAIPQELIESELFGHEKGSFTGAHERKKGKFELADRGTLFLDEIGDMSLQTQAKVLRVIETQEFQRVGGSKQIRVDVRIISATNKDLQKEVNEGRFREDLFYRLNVIPIEIPPLRERREDIPLLADFFLKRIGREMGKPEMKITQGAVKALQEYDWPGNVRELKNLIERLVFMSNSNTIEAKDIHLIAPSNRDYFSMKSLREARDAFEREFILRKLRENNWNISKTAEVLEIERSNLHRKIKAYGLS